MSVGGAFNNQNWFHLIEEFFCQLHLFAANAITKARQKAEITGLMCERKIIQV